MIKYFILFLIVAMLFSLFRGAFYLIKDGGSTKKTVHSLGVRVSIAVVLFITLIMISIYISIKSSHLFGRILSAGVGTTAKYYQSGGTIQEALLTPTIYPAS